MGAARTRTRSIEWMRGALAAVAVSLLAAAVAAAPPRAPDEEPEDGARSLADVVEGAETLEGLLTFHRSKDALHLQLDDDLVGAELGFAALLVDAVGDWSVRGSSLENRVVRWDLRDARVTLSKVNVDFRASPGTNLAPVVAASFPDSPVFGVDRIELSDDPAPILLEVSDLFGAELVEILPDSLGFSAKPDASTLLSLKTFPDNVIARVSHRFDRQGDGGDADVGNPFTRYQGPGRLPDPRHVQVTVDYHLYRLPDDGYRPRFADERIGGFTFAYKDYDGVDDRDTTFRHVLTRWDIRKSDPAAEVSPALEPVTFYIDRGVPDAWRPLVREGTLWWNEAFEAVGIRDAIRVLDQPDDPEWDPADLRHSMIYWNVSDNLIFSGMAGPMFSDPRTGKVLRANAYLNAEFPSYTLHRYLVYTWWRAPTPATDGALPTARAAREALRALRGERRFCDRSASFSSQIAFARLVLQSRGVLQPGTDEATRFAREAFLELVAHEIGHALGFPHNWKASLVSSHEDLVANRVRGSADDGPLFSSSVMDYNPIYLAPRGEPQADYFLHGLGPYDHLTVEYIYRPFDGMTAEQEAAALDAIAARAEIEPGLAYDSGGLGHIDPTTSADDLGDDPVAFAESRLTILREEVLPRLPELVLAEGHDYSHIRQALDAAVFSVAMDYVDLLARYVGGQALMRRVAGSPAAPSGGPPPVRPIAASIQRRALAVLSEQVFAAGAFSLSPDALALLKADMHYDWNYPWRYQSDYDLGTRVSGLYRSALDTLLAPARLRRVLDNERREAEGADRFTIPELFAALEQAAFDDASPSVTFAPDADRRALQRALVEAFTELAFEPDDGVPAEARQLANTTLRRIADRLRRVGGDGDAYAAAHRDDLSRTIGRLLDARVGLDAVR